MNHDLDHVGVTREMVDLVLEHDSDVLAYERVDGAKAMWRVTYSVDGQSPVVMLVDNGINDIYLQILVQVDFEYAAQALAALEPYGVAGLVHLAGGLYIRVGFFPAFSNIDALTNSLHSAALAYGAYRDRIVAG